MGHPTDRRLIDLTESDLVELIRQVVLSTTTATTPSSTSSNIVSGRANIAKALGISVDTLDRRIQDGTLKRAIRKNGRTIICDINKAFNDFNDIWQ